MNRFKKLIIMTALLFTASFAVQEITNPGAYAAGAQFGYAIDYSGERMVIGARYEDYSDIYDDGRRGVVRVYKYDGNNWQIEQTITNNESKRSDGFGSVVAISANFMAISNPKANTSQGIDLGAVYIYAFDGTSWNLQTSISANTSQDIDFGRAIDLDGDWLAIGAPGDDQFASNAGAVYIYQKVTSVNWVLSDTVIGSGVVAGEYFGETVSLSDSKLASSISQYSGQTAYIFEYNVASSNWQQEASINHTVNNDDFGSNVMLKNDYLLVAAPGENSSNGSDGGRVYIYKDNGVSWDIDSILEHPHANTKDQFGSSIFINDERDMVLVGVVNDDDRAEDAGSAILFRKVTGTWTFDRKYYLNEQTKDDYFGQGVITSKNVIISAYGKDFDSEYDNGVVMVYDHAKPAVSPYNPLIDDDYIHPSDSIKVLITDLADTIDTGSLSMTLTEGGSAKAYSTLFTATTNGQLLTITPNTDFNQKQTIILTMTIANSSGDSAEYEASYKVLPLNYRRIYDREAAYSSTDGYASAIDYSNDWLAVADASGDIPTKNDIGLINMYQRNGEIWQKKQVISPAAFTELDDVLYRSFGDDVAIDGDRMVVTAYNYNDLYYYLYENIAGTWTYQFKFPFVGSKSSSGEPAEVSIEGDRIVFSSPNDLGSNHYLWDGVSWNETQIRNTNMSNRAISVAISSTNSTVRIVMGSPYDDYPSNDEGSVYIYKWDTVTANWYLEKRFTAPDAEDDLFFGNSVALDDELLVVGTLKNKFYIYEYNSVSADWLLSETVASTDSGFGQLVKASNGNVMTSATGARNDDNVVVGKTFFYTKDEGNWILDGEAEPIDVNGKLLNMGSDLSMSGFSAFAAAKGDVLNSMQSVGSVYALKYHPQVKLRENLPYGSSVSPTDSMFAKLEGFYDLKPGSLEVSINSVDITNSCNITASGKFATINFTPDRDFIPGKEYTVSILVEDSENIEKVFQYSFEIEDLDIPTGSMISYFVDSGATPNMEVDATEDVKHKIFRIETGVKSGVILDQDMIRSIYAIDPDLDISDLLIESLGGGESNSQMSITVPTNSVLYQVVTPGNKLKLEFIYNNDHFIRVKPFGQTELKIVNDYDGVELPGLAAAYQSKYSDYSIDASANILSFSIDDFCQYGVVGVGSVSINEHEAIDETGSYLAEITVLAENSEGVYKVPVEIDALVGSANFSSSSSYLTDQTGVCYVTVNPVLLGDLSVADDSPYAGEYNAKVTKDITFDISGAQLPQIEVTVTSINTTGAPERGYPIVGVDLDSLRITINLSGDISLYQYSDPEITAVSGSMGYRVAIDSSVLWYNQQVTLDIEIQDDDSDVVSYSYQFETKDDTDEPVVTLVSTANFVSVNSYFVIDIYDAESGVSTNSISLAVNSGGTPYTLTVTTENYSDKSYRVTIDPTNPAILYGGDIVQLDVTVDDILNNQEITQFVFTVDKEIISSATDHDPAPGSSVNWDEIKSIYMKIANPLPSMTGRDFDSFTVQFKDTTYVTGDSELTVSGSVTSDYFEVRVSDDFGFTLTGQGGIQALADAMAAKEYLVTVDAIDTNGKNIGQYVYSFNILFGVDVDSLDIQKTLSCPTVFNPLRGDTTDLLYTLNEDKDTIVRIYDLRGYRLFQREFSAGEMGAKAGNNGVEWDGYDDSGSLVGNGIYIFYVVSSKGNIITKGKVVVSNR